MISSSLWSDPDFYELSQQQQLLWIALITQADDQGRLRGDPAIIRSLCFPASELPASAIADDLACLEKTGWIISYASKARPYIQIVNWWKHQTMQWAAPSHYPAPDGWSDRARYRQGEGVITSNWNCPEKPAYNQRINAVHTSRDADDTSHVDNLTKHNEDEQSIAEAAPPAAPPTAPPAPPIPAPSFDPLTRAQRKRYKLPAGPEPSEAVKVYLQEAHASGHPMIASEAVRGEIDAHVTAETVPKWREVCHWWFVSKGYRAGNLEGLFDVLAKGISPPGGNGHKKGARVTVSSWNEKELRKGREADRGQPWALPPDLDMSDLQAVAEWKRTHGWQEV